MSKQSLQRLLEAAPDLPFLTVVGLLEQRLSCEVGAAAFRQEAIRFRHDPALSFHTREITRTALAQDGDARPRIELTSCFAGLTGAASPLPLGLVEGIACEDDSTRTAAELFDLFHHRLLGLLYRGCRKTDLLGSERSAAQAVDWVLLLAGLDPQCAERTVGLPQPTLVRLAPLLVAHPASAERLRRGLEAALPDLLAPGAVRVTELAGGYVALDAESLARLGRDLRLGVTCALGRRVRLASAAIRVTISGLSPSACARLTDDGGGAAELAAVIRLLVPRSIEVAVVLRPEGHATARLGRGLALGRSAWLRGDRAAERTILVA